jgi:hypothetical protein
MYGSMAGWRVGWSAGISVRKYPSVPLGSYTAAQLYGCAAILLANSVRHASVLAYTIYAC